jgi:protein TonB
MKIGAIFAALLASSLTTTAHAQWNNFRDTSNLSCSTFREYADDGLTEVLIFRDAEGQSVFSLTNSGWSVEKGEYVNVVLAFEDAVIPMVAVGITVSLRRGLTFPINDKILDQLRASPALAILKFEDSSAIAFLPLNGSAKALAEIDKCLSAMHPLRNARQDAAAALERRRKIIPADPFATTPKKQLPVASYPKGNPGRWFTIDDLSPEHPLLKARLDVEYRIEIDETGKPTSCTLTQSTGDPLRDEHICTTLRSRAEFNPATDEYGKAVEGQYSSRLILYPRL